MAQLSLDTCLQPQPSGGSPLPWLRTESGGQGSNSVDGASDGPGRASPKTGNGGASADRHAGS